MKNLLILDSGKTKLAETINDYFSNNDNIKTNLTKSLSNLELSQYDIIAICGECPDFQNSDPADSIILNSHKSLLPAFDCENEVYEAINYGAKVSGITIYQITPQNPKLIITQYPVIISNLSHFEEINSKLENLECSLFPLVIEKIAQDKIFDFVEIINSQKSCSNGCHNCKK